LGNAKNKNISYIYIYKTKNGKYFTELPPEKRINKSGEVYFGIKLDGESPKYNQSKFIVEDLATYHTKWSLLYFLIIFTSILIYSYVFKLIITEVFSWTKIPGTDDKRIREFLRKKYHIDWVSTAEISKSEDGKTIRISKEDTTLSLTLNDNDSDVILKIDNNETDKFITDERNGELNIYEKVSLLQISLQGIVLLILFALDLIFIKYVYGPYYSNVFLLQLGFALISCFILINLQGLLSDKNRWKLIIFIPIVSCFIYLFLPGIITSPPSNLAWIGTITFQFLMLISLLIIILYIHIRIGENRWLQQYREFLDIGFAIVSAIL
jgi:hypothetical protein